MRSRLLRLLLLGFIMVNNKKKYRNNKNNKNNETNEGKRKKEKKLGWMVLFEQKIKFFKEILLGQ